MSVIRDIVQNIVSEAIREILKKPSAKRTKRRRGTAPSATARLRRLAKPAKPARRQISRKRTVRARSKAKRRSA